MMQRIGWGAGALLIVLIAIAIMPSLIVKYQVHAFTSRLRAGMTADDVRSAASSARLPINNDRAGLLIVEIREPWTFSSCSNDQVVVVTLASEHVQRWHSIGERICMKG